MFRLSIEKTRAVQLIIVLLGFNSLGGTYIV